MWRILRSSDYRADVQYVTNKAGEITCLLIGDYRGQGQQMFGFVEQFGDGKDGTVVNFYGDNTDYIWKYVGKEGDQAPEENVLYAYRYRADGVEAYRVNVVDEQIRGTYGEGDGSKAPACSSMDGKTGLNADTGEVCNCDTCPYNQYGTGIDDKGRQAKGKACKNMRRVYLLMSGDPNLYLLTIPPTSIRAVNRQLTRILSGGTPYVGMVMRFTLERVKNSGGIVYSKVQVQTAGRLPAAAIAQIRQMRAEIKKQHQSMAITLDDYEPAHAKGQPVDVNPDDAEIGQPCTETLTLKKPRPTTTPICLSGNPCGDEKKFLPGCIPPCNFPSVGAACKGGSFGGPPET